MYVYTYIYIYMCMYVYIYIYIYIYSGRPAAFQIRFPSIWIHCLVCPETNQGEPLVQHYLSNACVLQQLQIVLIIMIILDTTNNA